jgi:hypothetical protein
MKLIAREPGFAMFCTPHEVLADVAFHFAPHATLSGRCVGRGCARDAYACGTQPASACHALGGGGQQLI